MYEGYNLIYQNLILFNISLKKTLTYIPHIDSSQKFSTPVELISFFTNIFYCRQNFHLLKTLLSLIVSNLSFIANTTTNL